MNAQPQVIVVAGPTGSGKSDFAVELALKLGGEIISADSRQIYKELDICTGKITEKEMCGIRHYMIDICDVTENFSVAEYKRLALPLIEDIISRGKVPIICGGTGQYIDALIYNQEIPEVKPNEKLRNELEKKDVSWLYHELLCKDKRRAQEIDQHNKVRIIRALEIIEVLGAVPQQIPLTYLYTTKIYLMDIRREVLKKRITNRLYKRLQNGMIEEVQKIYSRNDTQTASTNIRSQKFGLEYVAIVKYLEGKISKEEMEQEIITKSMQYAKRQQTWNKKYTKHAIALPVEK